MSVIISAFFTNAGTPATGLSPTIRIRRLDTDALVVTDAAMVEVGDGFYDYDFTSTFSDLLDYAIRADGTATLSGADRYKAGGLDGDDFIIRGNIGNRADILEDTPSPGERTINVYDVAGTTIVASYVIDTTGLLRTRP